MSRRQQRAKRGGAWQTQGRSDVAREAQAIPGARLIYHVGDLARDRYKPDIARQACAWMRLADQRLVLLLQKRLGPNRFAYIAERTAKPVSAADHLKEITASGRQIVERLINIP